MPAPALGAPDSPRPPRRRAPRTALRTVLACLLAVTAASAVACGGDDAEPDAPTSGAMPPAPAATVDVREAVTFAERPGPDGDLVLDAYLPRPAGEPRPAVILVHGGGWRGGSRADMLVDAQILAQQGYVAFAVDYRKASEHPFPDQVDDVADALGFVRAEADDYGVDAERVSLFGVSAGGNIAALVGTHGEAIARAGGPPSAVVSWSGPMDLRVMARNARPRPGCTPGRPETGGTCALPELIVDQLPLWMGCPIDDEVTWIGAGPRPDPCPELYEEGSPVAHVSRGDSPMLLVHAEADPLVSSEQARLMRAALDEAGVNRETVIAPGEGHALQLRAEALAPTLAFLAAH